MAADRSVMATWSGSLSASDLLGLFGHFTLLSLLAVGGAITTASDMHRYVVLQHGWITDTQFSASVAIAQAAPGPNVMFVAVIGWNVAGPMGAFVTLAGTLLPSTAVTLLATRWAAQHRASRGMRAFTTGMAPVTVGLLLATGWVLAEPLVTNARHGLGAVALIAITVLVMLRTRMSPIWLVALGAAAGALGLA